MVGAADFDLVWQGGGSTDGNQLTNQHGVFGTMGVASASNWPGGRHRSASWYDAPNAKAYVFGGAGNGEACSDWPDDEHWGYQSDLWSYDMNAGQWTWEHGSKLCAP